MSNGSIGANDVAELAGTQLVQGSTVGQTAVQNYTRKLNKIQIKNGQNIILDLQDEAQVRNYFMQQISLLPVQAVDGFSMIYLSKNVVSQYSN